MKFWLQTLNQMYKCVDFFSFFLPPQFQQMIFFFLGCEILLKWEIFFGAAILTKVVVGNFQKQLPKKKNRVFGVGSNVDGCQLVWLHHKSENKKPCFFWQSKKASKIISIFRILKFGISLFGKITLNPKKSAEGIQLIQHKEATQVCFSCFDY